MPNKNCTAYSSDRAQSHHQYVTGKQDGPSPRHTRRFVAIARIGSVYAFMIGQQGIESE